MTSSDHAGRTAWTFDEAVDRLFSLQNFEIQRMTGARYTLEHIRHALHSVADPQDATPSVHIAGTKGKGSVAAMTASILGQADGPVGLYTSPHLHSVAERIRIDGLPVSEEDFARLVQDNWPRADDGSASQLTTFELLTLMALQHFRSVGCRLMVLEAGLGGRLDATNVVAEPICTAVTTIGLDHTEILGRTIAAISKEKAGIAKRGRPFLIAPQSDPRATTALAREATRRGALIVDVAADYVVTRLRHDLHGQTVRVVRSRGTFEAAVSLLGRFQLGNIACAVAIADVLAQNGWSVADQQIATGLATANWPARLEVVRDAPITFVDGAHNESSVSAVFRTIRADWPGRAIVCIVGVSRDKDLVGIADLLRRAAVMTLPVASKHPRAMAAAALGEALGVKEGPWTLRAAIDAATDVAGSDGIVLICGSLFVAAEARELMLDSVSD